MLIVFRGIIVTSLGEPEHIGRSKILHPTLVEIFEYIQATFSSLLVKSGRAGILLTPGEPAHHDVVNEAWLIELITFSLPRRLNVLRIPGGSWHSPNLTTIEHDIDRSAGPGVAIICAHYV